MSKASRMPCAGGGSDRAAGWVSSGWLLTVAQSSGRKKKVSWPFCGIALMAWSYRRGSGFAFRRVESVIADDEPLDLLAFGLGQRGRGIVEHADDLAGRGRDMYGRTDAVPQPGPGVGEQHHAFDGYRMAPGAQEAFELAGRFVDLLAGRTSPAVGHFPALNCVTVLVELGEPPVIAPAVNQRIAVLAFDRDQAPRAKQQMVDLAALVAVTPDQRPFVIQSASQPAGHQLLTFDTSHQDFLLVGCWPGGTRRFGGPAPYPADGEDTAKPCPPPVRGTGCVPRPLCLPDVLTMLCQSSLVPGRTSVVSVGPQPDLPEQGPGMIR